jgi:hypothetical protein
LRTEWCAAIVGSEETLKLRAMSYERVCINRNPPESPEGFTQISERITDKLLVLRYQILQAVPGFSLT